MKLTAAQYGSKLNRIVQELEQLLQSSEWKDTDLRQRLIQDLSDFRGRGFLTIAFVGEYSAGKSSLISALTARRDIKISADIATDQCSSYEWNGVHLIDTPGLWTERQDHDAITHRAIANADLLVFCLTHSLFNVTTLDNFIQLAYRRSYQDKMLLLVNKMSSEGGDVEERIKHYTASLQESLYPHDLSSFRLIFCDARDQLDGQDEDDEELKSLSRFDLFASELNDFIDRRRITARLDTPLRILLSYLDEATHHIAKDDDGDSLRSHVLRKLEGVIARTRRSLTISIDGLILDGISKIKKKSGELVQSLGHIDGFENEYRRTIHEVQKIEAQTFDQIAKTLDVAAESLGQEMSKELQSPLMHDFMTQLGGDRHMESDLAGGQDLGALHFFEHLGKLAQATGINWNAGFVTSSQASKLPLADAVRTVGKWAGVKFQPWGAANLAKGMHNIIPPLAVAISVLNIASEIRNDLKEKEKEKQLIKARCELRRELQNIADTIERELAGQGKEGITALLGEAEKHVRALKRQFESDLASHHHAIESVTAIRSRTEELLADVHSVKL